MRNRVVELVKKIEEEDTALFNSFSDVAVADQNLTRQLVSFQANKNKPIYRWYKYKEAFSADLIEYLCKKYEISNGTVLDPFSGAGTTLFSVGGRGLNAHGIELLPVGQHIIKSRQIVYENISEATLNILKKWCREKPWLLGKKKKDIQVYRITDGAYTEKTKNLIETYLGELQNQEAEAKELLLFALMCILESVSFTRKDGQYLRWDYRSGRRKEQNTFDKGKILEFDEAITNKLQEMVQDIESVAYQDNLFHKTSSLKGNIELFGGSCLEILPTLLNDNYSAVITSPPYANRYDYTRTYALEHALLGVKESELIDLRQAMISCTVENRAKELLALNADWQKAISICDDINLLQDILEYLELKKDLKELNNAGIARMIRGYFYEMACVIQEAYRVMKNDGVFIMVNDNVRYAGVIIAVDTILSEIARRLGFKVESILILPQTKGNSSQQMGEHGRIALRKCVYIWRKP